MDVAVLDFTNGVPMTMTCVIYCEYAVACFGEIVSIGDKE